jgi:hypothetical protein
MVRKSFLLRVDPLLLETIQKWADDDLRSLNGQIEFLLRKSLIQAGRKTETTAKGEDAQKSDPEL